MKPLREAAFVAAVALPAAAVIIGVITEVEAHGLRQSLLTWQDLIGGILGFLGGAAAYAIGREAINDGREARRRDAIDGNLAALITLSGELYGVADALMTSDGKGWQDLGEGLKPTIAKVDQISPILGYAARRLDLELASARMYAVNEISPGTVTSLPPHGWNTVALRARLVADASRVLQDAVKDGRPFTGQAFFSRAEIGKICDIFHADIAHLDYADTLILDR